MAEPVDTAVADAPEVVAEAPPPATLVEEDLLIEDLLIEDVSIDGMCGVY